MNDGSKVGLSTFEVFIGPSSQIQPTNLKDAANNLDINT